MIKIKKLLLLLPLLFSCGKNFNNEFINIKINELIFIDYNNFSYKITELGILTVEKGFVINDIYNDLGLFFDSKGPIGGGEANTCLIYTNISTEPFIEYDYKPIYSDTILYILR